MTSVDKANIRKMVIKNKHYHQNGFNEVHIQISYELI